jgi:hypothetical protein
MPELMMGALQGHHPLTTSRTHAILLLIRQGKPKAGVKTLKRGLCGKNEDY